MGRSEGGTDGKLVPGLAGSVLGHDGCDTLGASDRL